MFTAEKCKLFFNDPKFAHIKDWNEDSQEAAVTKIFAGQRKHRRSQVSKNTQQIKSHENTSQHILLDFLQSRMNAFEEKLSLDVQQLFTEKERIKDKYSEAEDLYDKSTRRLKKLMNSVKNESVNCDSIDELEKEVMDIQKLYEDNQFLKNMNKQIQGRIEKKKIQLGSHRI